MVRRKRQRIQTDHRSSYSATPIECHLRSRVGVDFVDQIKRSGKISATTLVTGVRTDHHSYGSFKRP
ncbi:hypothetical protein U1Q18_001110, partial [Sarracenia purpurea var. burkii]